MNRLHSQALIAPHCIFEGDSERFHSVRSGNDAIHDVNPLGKTLGEPGIMDMLEKQPCELGKCCRTCPAPELLIWNISKVVHRVPKLWKVRLQLFLNGFRKVKQITQSERRIPAN